MGMDQYLLIPFLGEWPSIYQLFWCELQGYKVLTHCHITFDSVAWFVWRCLPLIFGTALPPPKKKEPLQRVPTERGVLPQPILDQKTARVPSGND